MYNDNPPFVYRFVEKFITFVNVPFENTPFSTLSGYTQIENECFFELQVGGFSIHVRMLNFGFTLVPTHIHFNNGINPIWYTLEFETIDERVLDFHNALLDIHQKGFPFNVFSNN